MSSDNTELVKCLTKLLSLRKVNEFCAKLSAIAKRQGGFSKLSNEMSLNRESLYKALSGKRDPRFSTVLSVLSALGLKLCVEVDKEQLEAKLAGISGFEGAWLDIYLMSPSERLKNADKVVAHFNELVTINAANRSGTNKCIFPTK